MADDEIEFNENGGGVRQKISGFLTFLYNSKASPKTVLGRTKSSWAGIGLFYLIYYSCLAAFFGGLLAIFMQTVDVKSPTYRREASLIADNPGLGIRPMPNYLTTLIRFTKGNPASYSPYVDQLAAYLKPYRDIAKNLQACMADEKEMCNPSEDFFSTPECSYDNRYGYDDGKPCVLLKMNRIMDWVPQFMSNVSFTSKLRDNKNMPDGSYTNFKKNAVAISCVGQYPSDRLNIGKIKFIPEDGFTGEAFPYTNEKNYIPPFVWIKFNSITNGALVMVRCQLWADNIKNKEWNTKEGAVLFELTVD